MRAATLTNREAGGWVLLGLGVAALTVSLGLLILTRNGEQAGSTGGSAAELNRSTQDSVAFWEARVSADPADFVAYNKLANAYMQRGRETGDVSDYGRAQAAVDVSLAELPGDNAPAYATLATLQNVRHEFPAAVESARHALALDPADTGALAALGDAQLALGDYDAAFSTYNDLVSRAPGLFAFSRLAHIYELRGELGEAEAAWGNAFSTDSGRNAEASAWARVQYGNFLFNQGDVGGAESEYDAALGRLPSYVHAEAALARAAAADGDYERAIELYTGVTERQPLPEYVAALGDVYRVSGDEAAAARQYELIAAIDQLYRANGVNTDLQSALYLADHDLRLEEAVAQAQAVYEQQPDSVYAADAAAWTLYKAGRANEARPYVDQALRLGTHDANLFFHAGMVLAELGEVEAAREHLSRALEINPHFSLINEPVARQALAELGG